MSILKPNNGFTVDELATLVAEKLSLSKDVVATKTNDNEWAKNSKYYGTEINGYVYNPYLVRRWIEAQFLGLMKRHNLNVDEAIRTEYTYMYSIEYTLEESKKLAMLEKRDRVAFEERKQLFSLDSVKAIFKDYLADCSSFLQTNVDYVKNENAYLKINKCPILIGTYEEAIVDHEVVKELVKSEKLKTMLTDLALTARRIDTAYTYQDVYEIMKHFDLIRLSNDTKKSRRFVECFKKSGAFYTLKNLILFNNCSFRGVHGRVAITELNTELRSGSEAYQFYAMLKEVIKENDFKY